MVPDFASGGNKAYQKAYAAVGKREALKKGHKRCKKKQRQVKRSNVKRMRKLIGQKGGHARAGSGSTIAMVQKKEKQMAAHKKRHGAYPPKWVAWKLFKVSGAMFNRIVYTNSYSSSDSSS